AFFIDGFILFKTMREIAKQAEIDEQGNLLLDAFKHAKRAKPATKLVFYEDLVATFGAVLAIIGIVLSQFFGLLRADGIISIIIGLLMLFVVFSFGCEDIVGLVCVASPVEVGR